MVVTIDRKAAAAILLFVAGNVITPLLLSVLGIPPLITLSLTLLLSAALAFWAFPKSRWFTAAGFIFAGLLAGWSIKREAAYKLTFDLCRHTGLSVVAGDPFVGSYQLGIRPLNDTAFDLWARVDELSVTVADKAAKTPPPSPKPMRITQGNRQYAISNGVVFSPLLTPVEVGSGRMRIVVKYGRDPEELKKTLIASGDVDIIWLQDGETRLDFHPDNDSELPRQPDYLCQLPPPSVPRTGRAQS